MPPKIVNVRTVYNGWSRIMIATVEHQAAERFERLMEDHGNGVAVLPYDGKRKVAMLVRQFRAPVCLITGASELLETVAGLTGGEPPGAAALREVFEETGFCLQALEPVATVWTMPGTSTERMDLYLARYSDADRAGAGGGHPSEHENITVVEMPLAQLAGLADRGELTDMKTLALVQTLRLRAPDLFR